MTNTPETVWATVKYFTAIFCPNTLFAKRHLTPWSTSAPSLVSSVSNKNRRRSSLCFDIFCCQVDIVGDILYQLLVAAQFQGYELYEDSRCVEDLFLSDKFHLFILKIGCSYDWFTDFIFQLLQPVYSAEINEFSYKDMKESYTGIGIWHYYYCPIGKKYCRSKKLRNGR